MTEIKPSDLFEFLGVKSEEVPTIEDFKKKFEGEFIRKSLIDTDKDLTGKIFGKRIGDVETKLISAAKKHGIEWTNEDKKDKRVEELIELTLTKLADANLNAIKELEKTSGMTKDEAVKDWEKKYGLIDQKLKDTNGLLESTKTEFEGFKKSASQEKKNLQMTFSVNEIHKKLKYKPNIKDVEKAGFAAIIDQKYNFDLDEEGKLFATDKKGARIKSAKVTGSFMTPEELFEQEGITADVLQINPNPKQPAQKQNFQQQQNNESNKTAPIFVNPRFKVA